jgi:hypothetical protein
LFPREIESDLSLYHHIDIGDWHEGRLSSRRFIALLDGLPAESWYKVALVSFIEEMQDAEERRHAKDVSSLIFAQLTGQEVTASG